GSLGIDLETATTVMLVTSQPAKIPTTTYGPLTSDATTGALLIGRSSSGLNGLVVLPGVIDADFQGQICVIAYALLPPVTIDAGTRIAQLVLLQRHPATPDSTAPARGTHGFGSTGKHFVNLVQKMQQRPLLLLKVRKGTDEYTITAMCDTGADVTILS
ncbi:POK9 protein, partial [Grallaria varia]|nr:POK9 protein [Grallaria varia]